MIALNSTRLAIVSVLCSLLALSLGMFFVSFKVDHLGWNLFIFINFDDR